MTTELVRRPVQTRIKHDILKRYIGAWGGIITNGLYQASQSMGFRARFIYFDACSYVGRYLPDYDSSADFELGSPCIGIDGIDQIVSRAKQKGVNADGIVVLAERERDLFETLVETLTLLGYKERLKSELNFEKLRGGDIHVLNVDSTVLKNELLSLIASNPFMLAFLDPRGPTGIPLEFVAPLISSPRTDVIVNWGYYDLNKKSGLVRKSSLSPAEKALLQNYDEQFGDDNWRVIARFADDDSVEEMLLDHYIDSLNRSEPSAAVKSIRMEFPDADRTMYYLLLTTHNPDGAFAMNKLLEEATIKQVTLKQYRRAMKEVAKKQMAPMFDLDQYASAPIYEARSFDTAKLAEDILSDFKGQNVPLRAIKYTLINTDVHEPHIRQALTRLRSSGLASFTTLTNSAFINFVTE